MSYLFNTGKWLLINLPSEFLVVNNLVGLAETLVD
jgi:hypothetical protein